MNIVKNNYMGGGKNKGIILLKFIAAFLITYSHTWEYYFLNTVA